jgi:type II secretory pathway pseudopilin PulG
MAGGVLLVVVLVVGLLAPLGLYWLVRAEHDARETMDRAEAERTARRDVEDDGRDRR